MANELNPGAGAEPSRESGAGRTVGSIPATGANTKQTIRGIEDGTGRLVDAKGNERAPGIDPETGEYSTAQMMCDEAYGGDPSQPLFD